MKTHESNWRKFILLGEDDVHVRKTVVESWRRCKQAGVSYEKNRVPSPAIEADQWNQQIEKNDVLLRAARPVMQDAYNQLKGPGYQVDLTDPDGYMLEILADQRAAAASGRVGISAGVKWMENHVGTTGLTIALATRSPMVTSGAEHFWPDLWMWDCAAAPILVDNRFLGVLNVCRLSVGDGLKELLALAISLAHAVAGRVRAETLEMNLTTMTDMLSISKLACGSPGILAFNAEGGLVYKDLVGSHFLSALKDETNSSELSNLNEIQRNAKQIIVGETSHLILGDVGKEYQIASKEYRSRGYVTSTILFIRQNESPNRTVSCPAHEVFSAFPTQEERFRRSLERVAVAAKSDMSILLHGESGTGKDYMARAIHLESQRKDHPFIAINCASLPRDLIASELFGYAPGAFTGANRNGSAGKIEAATGGTLFLDEIGDMPLELQAVLLRALEEKQVTQVGSITPIPVDVRFIAATHKDLRVLVKQGGFREDLYYRLSIFTLHLPPLRERKADLEGLIQLIATPICAKVGRQPISLTPEAIAVLKGHPWYGNLRELRNVIERIAWLHEGDVVDADAVVDYLDLISYLDSLHQDDRNEKETLLRILDKTSGNRASAARELGMSRASLYRKLKKYGVDP